MDIKTHKLIKTLEEIVCILKEDNETHWSKTIQRCLNCIKKSDYSGVTLLLNCFGGIGSFNDLIICQMNINGQLAWKENYKEKNDRLHYLRCEAYELADYIKRNHGIGKP